MVEARKRWWLDKNISKSRAKEYPAQEIMTHYGEHFHEKVVRKLKEAFKSLFKE